MILVYATFPNKKSVEQVIKKILRKKLAVCINYWSIDSKYLWMQKIEKAKEWAIMIKTLKKNYRKIEELIKKNHPYQIPAIFSWSLEKVERNYLKWLKKTIKI
ncbi:MAG: divalent-cation tolerance protein CutA [Patescibacteria group bacterium]|nr:divalent-cation tolerance protein CutA [Patescibacteria group bacterium]